MRLGLAVSILGLVMSPALSLPVFAADPSPSDVPHLDCPDHPDNGQPHLKSNYDGQSNRECHGQNGESGPTCNVPPGNSGQWAEVKCEFITVDRHGCSATAHCSDGTIRRCGGKNWSAFAGVNQQGKAYVFCENFVSGADTASDPNFNPICP